ncbi:MAG TPA: iron transporter [Chloroflexota bacterium]|nr:iron transporter [Chloroflexota bacterium]
MRRFLVLPFLVALLLTGGIAAAMGNTIQKTTTAGPYKLVLKIGPPEKMSMKKSSGGEMMLGGKKATCAYNGGGMNMGGSKGMKTCNHHLELHVYNKSNGAVVQHATVAISMVDSKNHKTVVVPVMTMMGSKGMMDYHYGNNIYAGPGSYRVTVRVNKTMATFSVSLM